MKQGLNEGGNHGIDLIPVNELYLFREIRNHLQPNVFPPSNKIDQAL
jgi:hypothetical protein